MSEVMNPAAQFLSVLDVGDNLLSFRASREVDRIYAAQAEHEVAVASETIADGVSRAVRCAACRATGGFFGDWRHAADCDLDRTLTPQQRWAARNPGTNAQMVARSARKRAIKRRWAVLNGRCANCTVAHPDPGMKWCRACLDRNAEYREAA